MAYRVDISPSALQDAEDAYLWIKKRAPRLASAWYEGLLEAIYGLEQMPARCPVAPESEDLGLTIRQLLYGRKRSVYRILFAIGYDGSSGEDVVRIFRIRHSARLKATPEEIQQGERQLESDDYTEPLRTSDTLSLTPLESRYRLRCDTWRRTEWLHRRRCRQKAA